MQFGQIKACILAPSIGQDPNSKAITSKVPRIVTHSPRWRELRFLGFKYLLMFLCPNGQKENTSNMVQVDKGKMTET